MVQDELTLLLEDGQSDLEESSLHSTLFFEISKSSLALSFHLRLCTVPDCFLALATHGMQR
jgi:hypothetical protein